VKTATVYIILLLYLVVAYKIVLLTKADVASLHYSVSSFYKTHWCKKITNALHGT